MSDIVSNIDELMRKTCYLLDIFPCRVPRKSDNRYFIIEEYFQQNRQELNAKFCRILLKLYCYYDFWLLVDDTTVKNPEPYRLVEWIDDCFAAKISNIDIILPDCNAMIILKSDDLYMSLYNPNEQLKNLVSQLTSAEGLFFYKKF